MKYPIANNYIETLERVTKQLYEMAFTERHPEPLAYEEIQAMASEVNALDIVKLYSEAASSDSLRLYEIMFTNILSNPHVVNGTARKRITIIPYYPNGLIFESDNGNKLHYSIKDGMLIGIATYADGNTTEYEVISYLFDGDRITKRLIKEGWDKNTFNSEEHKLLFFFTQLNQLQESIFERYEDVRILFDFLENNHLKKYKNVNPAKNPDAFISLLEKEGKEKPEAWKAKTTITNDEVSYNDVDKEAKIYINSYNRPPGTYVVGMRTFNIEGKKHDLLTFLKGGWSKRAEGCLKDISNGALQKALEGGVFSMISNGKNVDILLYAFEVYAQNYINKLDQEKYKENIRVQASTFDKNLNTKRVKREIRTYIDYLLRP